MSASSTQFTFLVSSPVYRASSALCWLRPGRKPYEKPRKSVSYTGVEHLRGGALDELVLQRGRVQPTWTRKAGREYRYYACTKKVKEGYGQCPLPNLPAEEIETAVVDQLRALLRHPDVIARTYREISKAGGTGPEQATCGCAVATVGAWC
ncbi:MAG: hypothetical protein GVY16_08330 [Planctomycetes bacterium]|nr:zinc ribbon domain-containing protein [Phycisphaerae bacterium]NBB95732.1 hypothetical protein [Planctomycetota bacterium]